MKKIRLGDANIKYIYPEDIIRAWVFISFWISPFAVWKIYELIKPYIISLKG